MKIGNGSFILEYLPEYHNRLLKDAERFRKNKILLDNL